MELKYVMIQKSVEQLDVFEMIILCQILGLIRDNRNWIIGRNNDEMNTEENLSVIA